MHKGLVGTNAADVNWSVAASDIPEPRAGGARAGGVGRAAGLVRLRCADAIQTFY